MVAHRLFAHPSPRCGQRQDRFGSATSGFKFRTSARGLLRAGYRGGKPLRHPALPHLQTRASGSFGLSHCALRLNQSSRVLAPAALARYLRRCRSAYGFLRYNRVSACFAALTPDCLTLHKPNAQQVVLQRLMAPHCTLNAFNRLVLHSRSRQARCSRCARGCRWAAPTRSPALCHLRAGLLTAL